MGSHTLFHILQAMLCFENIDGLAQDCSNSIANAMELLQSCTMPSIWTSWKQTSITHSFPRPISSNPLLWCNTTMMNRHCNIFNQLFLQAHIDARSIFTGEYYPWISVSCHLYSPCVRISVHIKHDIVSIILYHLFYVISSPQLCSGPGGHFKNTCELFNLGALKSSPVN